MMHIRPEGFWFLDDPDDFKEIGEELEERHGLVVDEVCLADINCNQLKKMFDLEETRHLLPLHQRDHTCRVPPHLRH